jgi:hypothetical protein
MMEMADIIANSGESTHVHAQLDDDIGASGSGFYQNLLIHPQTAN